MGRREFVVQRKGTGRPDFSQEIQKAKTIAAVVPDKEAEEGIYYLAYIAIEEYGAGDGPLPFTMPPIAAGAEANLINAATGLDFFVAEAGYDCVVKEMWISFNQPIRWRMYSYYHEDFCCQAFFEANAKPLNVYPFGYQKSSMVPLGEDWKIQGRVQNLGAEEAYGKAWITILKQAGAYAWR